MGSTVPVMQKWKATFTLTSFPVTVSCCCRCRCCAAALLAQTMQPPQLQDSSLGCGWLDALAACANHAATTATKIAVLGVAEWMHSQHTMSIQMISMQDFARPGTSSCGNHSRVRLR